MNYILAIDQSTSGTKALLIDGQGDLVARSDATHRQIVNDLGWVEHDPEEIYRNTLSVVRGVVEKAGVPKRDILGVGISNQRETAMIWEKRTGIPVYNAIVWQCARGEKICRELSGASERIRELTGLHLSPYFSAAKLAWILRNVKGLAEKELCAGTMDSWLVYRLTGNFKTDYSNASRTQLLDIRSGDWSDEVCGLFRVPREFLPELCDSDGLFGETNFEGYLGRPIPVHAVLGDSHGALFGQCCWKPGMVKATYGTGSSVMMNIGPEPLTSRGGLVTSIAWRMGGRTDYVLEGNINYSGAVMAWLQKDLGLISSPKEASALAESANPDDETYLVPAFSGLGAPYWNSGARAAFSGMSRTTRRAELVRAAEDCIAYQVSDLVCLAGREARMPVESLRVDGGPTRDRYLMQFESDILGIPVSVSAAEEVSGIGAAYAAGLALGLYDRETLKGKKRGSLFLPKMAAREREKKKAGWEKAVARVLAE